MNVKTYKGLSHRLFLFGLQPVDLAFLCLSVALIWMFTFLAVPTLAGGIVAYYCLKRLKHVDMDTRKIFIRFIISPARIGIRTKDIPSYRLCLK